MPLQEITANSWATAPWASAPSGPYNYTVAGGLNKNTLSGTENSGHQHSNPQYHTHTNTHEDEDEDLWNESFDMKWDCNQIRNKINTFIRNGGMKVTEFQKHLGINARSYGAFMKQSGAGKGMDSNTYAAPHQFFSKREAQGLTMPRAKKAKKEDLEKYNVEDITLDGEDSESVPIYDTCDDLRTKIAAHLRLPGMTMAGFGREIAKTFLDQDKKIQGKQVTDFLKKKGPTSGSESSVYYAAYVYFEKLRIKNGKDKSKKRREVEEVWSQGMKREGGNKSYWVRDGEVPVEDAFGRVSFVPGGGRRR